MLTPGDVFRKFLIRASVGADQLVVTVTDTNLCHCSLKNCRLVIILSLTVVRRKNSSNASAIPENRILFSLLQIS